jgi:hypothetical protein
MLEIGEGKAIAPTYNFPTLLERISCPSKTGAQTYQNFSASNVKTFKSPNWSYWGRLNGEQNSYLFRNSEHSPNI